MTTWLCVAADDDSAQSLQVHGARVERYRQHDRHHERHLRQLDGRYAFLLHTLLLHLQ